MASSAKIRRPGGGSRLIPAFYDAERYRERRQFLLDFAEVLCTAQELVDLRAELEAADPQAWPSIRDLYGQYLPHREGSR